MSLQHPLPEGTRIHHRNCLWNNYFTEEERQARPSWGWATVLRSVPQRDRTYEYEVRYDAPMFEGGNETGWWASYHIDRSERPPHA